MSVPSQYDQDESEIPDGEIGDNDAPNSRQGFHQRQITNQNLLDGLKNPKKDDQYPAFDAPKEQYTGDTQSDGQQLDSDRNINKNKFRTMMQLEKKQMKPFDDSD